MKKAIRIITFSFILLLLLSSLFTIITISSIEGFKISFSDSWMSFLFSIITIISYIIILACFCILLLYKKIEIKIEEIASKSNNLNSIVTTIGMISILYGFSNLIKLQFSFALTSLSISDIIKTSDLTFGFEINLFSLATIIIGIILIKNPELVINKCIRKKT